MCIPGNRKTSRWTCLVRPVCYIWILKFNIILTYIVKFPEAVAPTSSNVTTSSPSNSVTDIQRQISGPLPIKIFFISMQFSGYCGRVHRFPLWEILYPPMSLRPKFSFQWTFFQFYWWFSIVIDQPVNCGVVSAVADLHSKILDARPPWGSKFFQFHAVFGKIWQVFQVWQKTQKDMWHVVFFSNWLILWSFHPA